MRGPQNAGGDQRSPRRNSPMGQRQGAGGNQKCRTGRDEQCEARIFPARGRPHAERGGTA